MSQSSQNLVIAGPIKSKLWADKIFGDRCKKQSADAVLKAGARSHCDGVTMLVLIALRWTHFIPFFPKGKEKGKIFWRTELQVRRVRLAPPSFDNYNPRISPLLLYPECPFDHFFRYIISRFAVYLWLVGPRATYMFTSIIEETWVLQNLYNRLKKGSGGTKPSDLCLVFLMLPCPVLDS